MVETSCHCGQVRFALPQAPETVTACNCSSCRRYGTLWAYYPKDEVRRIDPKGATEVYVWGAGAREFHRCAKCGCVTHWQPLKPEAARMGVNARMLEPEVLAMARVRRLDGADTWEYLD